MCVARVQARHAHAITNLGAALGECAPSARSPASAYAIRRGVSRGTAALPIASTDALNGSR